MTQYSDDARASHRWFSKAAVDLLTHVGDDPAWLRRAEFAELEGAVPETLQPWPTLITRWRREELHGVATKLFRLLKQVPRRAFAADPGRFARWGGVDPRYLEGLLDDGPYLDSLLARADLMVTRDGVKCVEINASAALGGWDVLFALPRYRHLPLFQRFIEASGTSVSVTNPVAVLMDHLAARRLSFPLAEGSIVFAAPAFMGDTGAYQAYLQYESDEACARARVPATAVRVALSSAVEHGDGVSTHEGERIGVLVQAGLPIELNDAISDGLRRRTMLSLNGPLAMPLGDKRLLAVLSDPARLDLTTEERGVVDSHIPWTRVSEPGRVTHRGHEVELAELAASAQGGLVLKPGIEFGGRGVLVGAETSAPIWEAAVRDALASGAFVFQERLASLPFVYQSGDVGCSEHALVLGLFMAGDAYGGCSVRVGRADRGSVVNVGRGAEKSLLLEVDE